MTNNNKRAILIVLDSVGIGGATDASNYGDAGANTLGNIVNAANEGKCDISPIREGSLQIPNLEKLGILNALELASGKTVPSTRTIGAWGVGVEHSIGKDTTTGHLEIAACPVQTNFHYFSKTKPSIPEIFIDLILKQTGIAGVIGNQSASGTQIMQELGSEHIITGKPIIYTSADSVIQIAADESSFGLERLYDVCEKVRLLADTLQVGRVIARPFVQKNGSYIRTENRRDYSMLPPAETILDKLKNTDRSVVAVGKISDIFAGQGITKSIKASGIDGTINATLDAITILPVGGMVFSNVVEFDSEFGHRRDVAGYANALEQFDRRLPELTSKLEPGDLLIITADHGNDPTFRGSDHTRECTPILMTGAEINNGNLGLRGFADIGATIAEYLDVPNTGTGTSFLSEGAGQ